MSEGRVLALTAAPSLAVIAMLLVLGGTVFVVFFFPVLAHRTYFSENALLVNAAQPSFDRGDALVAQKVRTAGARVPCACTAVP